MLVSLEAGGLLRGLLLLLLYPLLRLLTDELAMKAMVMVTFAGLRKDAFGRLGMAVMPKLVLPDASAEVGPAATSAPGPSGGARRRRRCVCVSSMPRAMVEPFLKEYLAVDAVIAPELRELGGYYRGRVEDDREVARRMDGEEVIGAKGGAVVGIGGQGCSFQHIFQKYCKVSHQWFFLLLHACCINVLENKREGADMHAINVLENKRDKFKEKKLRDERVCSRY